MDRKQWKTGARKGCSGPGFWLKSNEKAGFWAENRGFQGASVLISTRGQLDKLLIIVMLDARVLLKSRGFWRGRGGGFRCGGLRFALGLDDAEGDLCRIEDLAASFGRDGADEDSVGGAGDEVADAFRAGEDGHGIAVPIAGVLRGKDVVVEVAGLLLRCFVSAVPGGETAADSGFGAAATGAGSWGERGAGRGVTDGCDEASFFS
jgi:hypothetical protein